MANSIEVILNARSGSHQAQETRQILEEVLGESGRSFAITVVSGRAIERVAQEKAASGCEILVAGLTTFNQFAHNLAIPLGVEAAARVLFN